MNTKTIEGIAFDSERAPQIRGHNFIFVGPFPGPQSDQLLSSRQIASSLTTPEADWWNSFPLVRQRQGSRAGPNFLGILQDLRAVSDNHNNVLEITKLGDVEEEFFVQLLL